MALWTGQGPWWRWPFRLLLLALVAALSCAFYVEFRYRQRIVSPPNVPDAPVALVFGAGLSRGGIPSPVLRQRLDAAIGLYRMGKVKSLLVSGDNTDRYHDETASMRKYVLGQGLPASDVIGDDAGVSTYDSCLRGREVFGVRRAILVTQDFHLPRALFIANSLGIDAWGIPADAPVNRAHRYRFRELVARALAVPLVLARPPARIAGRVESTGAPQG
jgi:vancomycin permeability regulator SanA